MRPLSPHDNTKFPPRYKKTFKRLFVVTCILVVFVMTFSHGPTISEPFSASHRVPQSMKKRAPDLCDHKVHNGNRSIFNTRWVVVTSISHPTQQIVKLSQIPGWQVLVVGDEKTPTDWALQDVILLDVDAQLNLGYSVLKYIPWNSYARKIVGYLYAIQNGAEIIYDTDDDNAPDGDVSQFEEYFSLESRVEMRGLVMTPEVGSKVKNPYVHFGQGTIWPRGYPLDEIGGNYTPVYTTCRTTTPSIQQGVVNGDPDVDAILRLTKKKAYAPLNIQFDSRAPPSIFPEGLFAPFNSQNTIFLYDAFWALVLPVSVPFRVTDIWRGYWAQPLLWKTGNYLGFFAPHTTQLRNAHKYLKDFAEEIQLYQQTGDLINFLSHWKCQQDDSDTDLYNCMMQLTVDMVNEEFWGPDEINLISAWITDLQCIGYRKPSIKRQEKSKSPPCLPDAPKSSTIFHAMENDDETGRGTLRQQELIGFCNFRAATNISTDPIQYPSTLLIVTFNFPYYNNIWLLDVLYRPHFPNIIYCGKMKNSQEILKLESHLGEPNKFSFIHADVTNGFFSYECALRAIDMNYGVENFLILSDDVLLNFWTVQEYDRNEMWTTNFSRRVNVETPFKGGWWGGRMGRLAFNATMAELSRMLVEGDDDDRDTVRQFFKTRETHGLNNSIARKGISDTFFLPKSKQNAFYKIGWMIRKHKVFLEYGLPLLVTGLSSAEKYVIMKMKNLWGGSRGKIWQNYNSTEIDGIHPVKLSQLGKPKFKTAWCNNYVANALLH